MERAKKEQVVAELHDKLKRASATILTDFKGMTVAEMGELRDVLAAEQVEYQVVKNTLMRLAGKDTDAVVLEPLLKDTCAIAIGYSDPSIPAKILKKFSKSNEKLKIKGGALGTRLLDLNQVSALAELPSREELLGKLLGTLNAVPTGLVTVLSGVPRAFVTALTAIRDKKEAA
ncbi:MAG: 50S ribosomal protein L10 [Desulforhabdus sp.]|nr:50S ribosomal protein L10 [Desulforhabdus sp.]